MATGSFDRFVDAAHRGQDAGALGELAPDALFGVTTEDARLLAQALGVRSVAGLARHAAVRHALAIAEADIGHDRGPDAEWSAFFARAPLAGYQQHPQEFRLDFGPVYYRGRLDDTARVLVIGQDPAANELVGHRTFIGRSGQRVQGFLRRLGILRDYVMVNTFLYPVYGQFAGALRRLTQEPAILGFRNALLDRIAARNAIEAVIAVGNAARDAVERWPAAPPVVCHITHPSAPDHAPALANWNRGLTMLRAAVSPEAGAPPDPAGYGTNWTEADDEPIPRRDLPFGLPDWHGTGEHATRARGADGGADPKRIVWEAP